MPSSTYCVWNLSCLLARVFLTFVVHTLARWCVLLACPGPSNVIKERGEKLVPAALDRRLEIETTVIVDRKVVAFACVMWM